MTESDTSAQWEANAPAWIEMSRAGADRYRDLVNTPAFLAALPDVDGLRCLDVGCGEGHNTRLLRDRGAQLTAIDISRSFVIAARDTSRASGPPIDHLHADATRLPFADGTFDAATAFMSVMDTPDPTAVLADVARVLRPGGWFQFSITHPTSTTRLRKWIDDDRGVRTWLAIGDYFEEGTRTDTWTFSTAPAEMRARHAPFTVTVNRRTVAWWMNAVVGAGLTIEHVVEPAASEAVAEAHPDVADTRIIPFFLIIRARRR